MTKYLLFSIMILCSRSFANAQMANGEITYQAIFEPSTEDYHDLVITIEGDLTGDYSALYLLIGDAPGRSNVRVIKFDLSIKHAANSSHIYQHTAKSTQIRVYNVPVTSFVTLTVRDAQNQLTELTSH